MSSLKIPTGNWNYPTTVYFGAGQIAELAKVCRQLGMRHPLLVTDAGLAVLPLVTDILKTNVDNNLSTGLFCDVKPNPTGKNIEDGVKAYHAGKHDGIIGLGGGSGLDAAKAIALMVGQSLPIWDFEDVGDNWTRVDEYNVAPVVAVPTTAGTGSEVGRASVILDEVAQIKKIIFHPTMMPAVVIADPELTVGLSPKLTAATGMDALSHNLEAFCAPGFHPMADAIAVQAMCLVKESLATAYHQPDNIVARSNMLAASTMGATAFQKGLGGIHALAHPLGALYDAHHGMLNAILMPYVLAYNRDVIDERMTLLARFLDLETYSFDAVLEWVCQLRKEIGIPNTLSEIGITDEQLERVAEMAVEDPSAAGNPKLLSIDDYREILKQAIGGE